MRDQIISEVIHRLSNDAKKPGSVLYNGWNTLCPSHGLYIMGFNPGGDPDQIEISVIKSFELEDDYCSYEDECWRKSCPHGCQKHRGQSVHQRRVKELAQVLGYKIREVFAANAIFVRSKNQNDLDERERLFDKCWPIHQIFLSIVKPKIILCLGNGERSSAFAFLKEKLKAKESHVGNVKAFLSEIPLADGETIRSRIIGVRHPSRPWFNPVRDLRLFLEMQDSSAGI
ncbi:MAG: hypothetical protein KF722_06025 [Nitrospira sp.]|nr:hypothetical protein [Nitrospira sp.]